MKKSPLIIIFFVIFIDLLGFGIVIPILPYYGVYYGASASQIGGPTATDPTGRVYFSGWSQDGRSLVALDGGESTIYNLDDVANVPSYHMVQGLVTFENRVYVRLMDNGQARTFSFDPSGKW